MEALNAQSQLPRHVQSPGYQPQEHKVGIIHFGLGAFHRAHMAVYTDSLLAAAGGDWRITGISLRSSAVRDRLAPQDFRYTLVERSDRQERLRVIGCLQDVLVAPENPGLILQRLQDPHVRILSFTITEKGYHCDPVSAALLCEHPDIVHDLENPRQPKTIYGFITEALARRRAAGHPAVTLLCCDNLPENGRLLKRLLVEFALRRDADLAAWIEARISCPCTMVDRIVPATTDDDIERTAAALGYRDAAPVICEPFSQWVIEDDFSSPRPSWENVGVSFVGDVAPYEEMKLRLLNGSHSAMAYLGYLGGIETIDQVIRTPAYLTYIRGLMKESLSTLSMPESTDLEVYCEELIRRFRNPALKHRTWQIAMDGSQKLPQRLLNSIRFHLEADTPYAHLAMAVAGWMRYVTGIDEQGKAIEVSDPLANRLRGIAEQTQGDAERYVNRIIAIEEIFGRDLAAHEPFRRNILKAFELLEREGSRTAVTHIQSN